MNKEIGGLHEAAYLLGFFSIFSQILALIRDKLFAYNFGASHTLDIYYAAFRIPDLIFVSVASLVSLSIIIPFLTEKVGQGREETKKFINNIFSLFFLLILIVSIVAFFVTPYFIKVFFPYLLGDFENLILMTRILLLSPILLGLSNLLANITQIYKRFFVYAISPILYNVGIIFGILVLFPIMGLKGLALGVAIGAAIHLLIQVPFVYGMGLLPRFTFKINLSSIKKVVFVSLPRTITVSVNELAKFFLISFASFIGAGSISIFNFSFNLQSVPLSVIGVSYSLAAFPTLSKLFVSGEVKKFVEQMVMTSKHIIFWSLPVVSLFIVLRAQVVRVVLGAGRFDWTDTRLTAAALAIFVLSLIPQSLVMLFVRAYYSRGDTAKPLLLNLISAIIIIFSSYYAVKLFENYSSFRFFMESLFKVSDVPGSSLLMLPLGFSFGVTINLLLHWVAFHREFKEYSAPVLKTLFQSFSTSIIMGFTTYRCLVFFGDIFDIDTFIGIFLQGFLSGIIGIVAGLIVMVVLRNKELVEIWSAFHKKFWKAKVVGPDPDMV